MTTHLEGKVDVWNGWTEEWIDEWMDGWKD